METGLFHRDLPGLPCNCHTLVIRVVEHVIRK